MTNQEAIKYIENHGYFSDDVKDIAIKALEKQIAKKPVRKPNLDWTNEEVTCPSCNRNVSKYRNKYCDCGQKLNWGEEE